MDDILAKAGQHFVDLVSEQLQRVAALKQAGDWIDYRQLAPIIIGVCGGDGIGPAITHEAQRVIAELLSEQCQQGKVQFRSIDGLTIENRIARRQAIPDAVLAQIKACHVILKGPTTTPEKGNDYPNIESANVAMRRELDLFANVRPIKVPDQGIDWTFFRENTEGSYILGSKGLQVNEDLAFDFTVVTRPGTERIIRMAFEFCRRHQIDTLTVVTKANVIKTSDGLFLETAERLGREYPEVKWEGWYIDIMTAKLIDPRRRRNFRVFVLPNLYGDILTDEAAEFQGGVGTAGSANIGKRYAMFEAIHGSAPRMVKEGRSDYADPSSMIRAGAMLLRHIGFSSQAQRLEQALEICVREKRKIITGRPDGCTAREFGDYLLETIAQLRGRN